MVGVPYWTAQARLLGFGRSVGLARRKAWKENSGTVPLASGICLSWEWGAEGSSSGCGPTAAISAGLAARPLDLVGCLMLVLDGRSYFLLFFFSSEKAKLCLSIGIVWIAFPQGYFLPSWCLAVLHKQVSQPRWSVEASLAWLMGCLLAGDNCESLFYKKGEPTSWGC